MFTHNLYELLWIFIIYAILGWCMEVVNEAFISKKFVNRGFLNGPYCPIYGFGIVAVVELLQPYKENILILFLGSIVLTTILEFITGYILEKVFHRKWWDYDNEPINLGGYICIRTSLIWGLACVFIIAILQPRIIGFISIVPLGMGHIILIAMIVILLIDFIVTVITLFKYKKIILTLENIREQIKSLSSLVGKNISDNTTLLIKKKNIIHMDELIDLKNSYQIISDKISNNRRIFRAFPNLKNINPKNIKTPPTDCKDVD